MDPRAPLKLRLGVVAQVCDPSTWEVEAGGSRIRDSLSYVVSLRLAWTT